jgi:hypothetical protein
MSKSYSLGRRHWMGEQRSGNKRGAKQFDSTRSHEAFENNDQLQVWSLLRVLLKELMKGLSQFRGFLGKSNTH